VLSIVASIVFILLIFCAPYLLMKLTQKENTVGHWYPVTLLYLKHRKEYCDDNYGYRRYFTELLNFLAYFMFIVAIFRKDFDVAAVILAFAGFISYQSEYFVLVHKLYKRAKTTTVISLILAGVCLYLAHKGHMGEGELLFYCFILAIIWHVRITVFRAVHWYKLDRPKKANIKYSLLNNTIK